jgi:Subtilase family
MSLKVNFYCSFWRRLSAFILLTLTFVSEAAAELWRSPAHEMTFVQVEKRLRNPLLDAEVTASLPPSEVFEPLPEGVEGLLGPRAVNYDSFVVTYLPEPQAVRLAETARAHGLVVMPGTSREIRLPWHAFEAGDLSGRSLKGYPGALRTPRSVPRLFILQFAYPVQEPWLVSLEACGAQRIATLQERTLLVRAENLGALVSCGVSRYFSWIDAWLNTDRVSPELLAEENLLGYKLQYAPGTDLRQKRATLPGRMRAEESAEAFEESLGFLHVKGPKEDLVQLIADDPDLLSVVRQGEWTLSDERQGQIVAGNHDGTKVTTPGYRTWLSNRGLLTTSNRQTVCIVDSGYDDGEHPSVHHPDLENPDRLIEAINFGPRAHPSDANGHGTMVAGIIAGESATGTGSKDPQGFYYGSGIAPSVDLLISDPGELTTSQLSVSLDFCRYNAAIAADKATIVNNSYNTAIVNASGIYLPDNEYDELAMFFDDKAIDASQAVGIQAATIIFSAGNFAYDYGTQSVRRDSVSSPATAKNVISVGSTTSYRPSPEPPLDCRPTPENGSRPPDQDALHISRLGLFSGRGKSFSTSGSDKAHTVRIKPDLVAPGVRVFSTVPYQFPTYTFQDSVGCVHFYPDSSSPGFSHHTYGTGTSFSAPVVTGAAAHKRKWFLDRGTDPSPSLLKAALIATADTIGGVLGNDHRPSPNSGWGRVNLNRLTDSRARFYVKDNQALAVITGQQRAWTRTIENPSSDTYIVLAWSDPRSDFVSNSQAPLKNNLSLTIEETGTTTFWRGNNFNENLSGLDNGYSYRFTPGSLSSVVDAINNVEAIFIPAGTFATGQKLTIKVTGENVTTGSQKFSIYAYNVQLSQ